MKPAKPLFVSPERDAHTPDAHEVEARQIALEFIAAAWNDAEDEGLEPDALAHASLFAAITTLVNTYGEEAAASLIGTLPDRIRAGEYNLDRRLQ